MRWLYYLSDAGLAEIYRQAMSVPPSRRVLKTLFGIGVVVGLCTLLYLLREPFAPTDWVELTVRHVPPGTRQIYLIADRADGVRALSWYISKVIADAVDPRHGGEMWYWDR